MRVLYCKFNTDRANSGTVPKLLQKQITDEECKYNVIQMIVQTFLIQTQIFHIKVAYTNFVDFTAFHTNLGQTTIVLKSRNIKMALTN